jgi:hypothetical protein
VTLTTDRPAVVLRVRGVLLTGAAGVATAALLAACGGGSTATTTAGSTPAGPQTVAATGNAAAPGPNGPAGDGGAQFQKIQECLAAAGVSLPTPTGGPGGAPPSGAPTDGMSGAPGGGPGGGVTQGPDGKFTAPDGDVSTAMPTPGADGRGPGDGDGGGFAQMFSDPTVQAALKACGLTVPTGGPRPRATATSTS